MRRLTGEASIKFRDVTSAAAGTMASKGREFFTGLNREPFASINVGKILVTLVAGLVAGSDQQEIE